MVFDYGLQVDPDTFVSYISRKFVVYLYTISEDPLWNPRVPVRCEPFDGALDAYLNEYVQAPSTVQPHLSTSTSVCYSSTSCSLSNQIFSYVPHAELMSKRVR